MEEIQKIYKRGPWMTYDKKRVRVKVDPNANLGIANTSVKHLIGAQEYEVTYNSKTGAILAVSLKHKGEWIDVVYLELEDGHKDIGFFEFTGT